MPMAHTRVLRIVAGVVVAGFLGTGCGDEANPAVSGDEANPAVSVAGEQTADDYARKACTPPPNAENLSGDEIVAIQERHAASAAKRAERWQTLYTLTRQSYEALLRSRDGITEADLAIIQAAGAECEKARAE